MADELNNDSLLELYLYESSSLLDSLDEILLGAESAGNLAPEKINEIFRIIHTIKGSSSMMSYSGISEVAHKTEDLFSAIRKYGLNPGIFGELFDVVLAVSDFLKIEVNKVQEGRELEEDVAPLTAVVMALTEKIQGDAPEAAEPGLGRILGGPPAPKTKPEPVIKAEPEPIPQVIFLPEAPEGGRILGAEPDELAADISKVTARAAMTRITPDAKETYFLHIHFNEGSKMENIRAFMLVNKLSEKGTVNRTIPSNPETDPDAASRIIENGFYVSFTTSLFREQIENLIKGTLSVESVSFARRLPDDASGADAGSEPPQPAPRPQPIMAGRSAEQPPAAQPAMPPQPAIANAMARQQPAMIPKPAMANTAARQIPAAHPSMPAKPAATAMPAMSAQPAISALPAMSAQPVMSAQPAMPSAQPAFAGRKEKQYQPASEPDPRERNTPPGRPVFVDVTQRPAATVQPIYGQARPEPEPVSEPVPEPVHVSEPEPRGDDAHTAAYAGQNIISVELKKLDALLDLVGEIVINESMVTENPELEGLELPGFRKAARQLDKLSNELQDTVMAIRMLPVSIVFHRMKRIVRDMGKSLSKEVNLILLGDTTEVDKTILDSLSDPLMHLVRNAMDHAIETREERIAAGKNVCGSIVISAQTSGGDVIISVSDDGRGLDKGLILGKARANGFLRKPESEYSDKEIYNLLMAPGFSTRERVSVFSGRGVGLDVVKSNIERIGGAVIIESKAGVGTNIILKIPLTLAIISCIEIAIGREVFAIPINSIREAFKSGVGQLITGPSGEEMIMLRGNAYPIVRLYETFGVEGSITDLEGGILIIVDTGDGDVCLLADSLVGKFQVVVKPLPVWLNRFKVKRSGVSGCTIMGNGNISLIVNVQEMAR